MSVSNLRKHVLEASQNAQIINGRGLEEREESYLGLTFVFNNNSGKRSRVYSSEQAGPNPTIEQLFAYYDRSAGLILLAPERRKVPNGIFWSQYEAKLLRRKKLKQIGNFFSKFTKHPVVASLLVIFILFIIYLIFGIDLNNPGDKTQLNK